MTINYSDLSLGIMAQVVCELYEPDCVQFSVYISVLNIVYLRLIIEPGNHICTLRD